MLNLQWISITKVVFAAGGTPLSAKHWYSPICSLFIFVIFMEWPAIEEALKKNKRYVRYVSDVYFIKIIITFPAS